MFLLDIAQQLNKRNADKLEAAEQQRRQAELNLRRLSYYQEFGAKWFKQVSLAIDEHVSQFNATTGEHSKLGRQPSNNVPDLIVIYFVHLDDEKQHELPTCLIRRNAHESKVAVENMSVKTPHKEEYDVIANKEFSELKVHVSTVVKTLSGRNSEPDGDYEFPPKSLSYKDIKRSYTFNPHEFSDFILYRFVENML